jgi:hypothetical protein
VIGLTTAINVITRNQSLFFLNLIRALSVNVNTRISPFKNLFAAITSFVVFFNSLIFITVKIFFISFFSVAFFLF